MATAQDLFVRHFVSEITGNGNLGNELTATELHPGVLSIRGKLNQPYDRLYIVFHPAASTLTGAGQFSQPGVDFFGDPYNGAALLFSQIGFPPDLAPGDTVGFNVGYTKAGDPLPRSLDLTYTLPRGTVVDPGGHDWHADLVARSNTAAAVSIGSTGTPGPGPLADIHAPSSRLLAVFEADDQSPDYGRLIGIDPAKATGIGIPTFQMVAKLPALGTNRGEAVYSYANRQGYIWDGAAWRDIAPSPILSYPTEADLVADTKPSIGNYGVARDTGNLYVRVATGWRIVGLHVYPDVTTLLAASPVDGTLAEAVAEGMVFLRTGGRWRPTTIWEDTEANIRANTTMPNGVEAVSTDTGRTFARIAGTWVEEPINHYATETALLAATPPDGTLAWADDTNAAFTRAGGSWNRLGGPAVTVGTADPQAAGTPTSDGDLWADTSSSKLKIWQSGAWVSLSTTPITVSAVAPASPAAGDMWVDTATPAYGVRYWDGAHWQGVTGTSDGAGTEGSYTRMPGYFDSTVPGSSAAANDVMGVAGWYSGNEAMLYLKKGGGWHAATPKLGDSANEGRAYVADANGNASWGGRPAHRKTVYGDNINQSVISLDPRPQNYCRVWGHFAPKLHHCWPRIIGQLDGNWIDWSSNTIFEAYSQAQYKDNGYEWTNLKGVSATAGGYLMKDGDGNYKVGQHAPCYFEFVVYGFGLPATNDYAGIRFWLGPYKSSNSTIMDLKGMWRGGATFVANKLSMLGIKCDDNGSGGYDNLGPISMSAEWG